jgi:hypothetical protein
VRRLLIKIWRVFVIADRGAQADAVFAAAGGLNAFKRGWA